MAIILRAALAGALILSATGLAAETLRPMPRPADLVTGAAAPAPASAETQSVESQSGQAPPPAAAAATETPALAAPAQPAPAQATAARPPARDMSKGSVTNLPLPRFVSLKGNGGNARRGPGLTHRIDWVFTRSGMPLKITAEYEHWRRVEDAEGFGGWVNYALLSGVRSALVAVDMAEFRARPQDDATVTFKAERNVIGWIEECLPDWCRLSVQGEEGWIRKTAIWGVKPDETIE